MDIIARAMQTHPQLDASIASAWPAHPAAVKQTTRLATMYTNPLVLRESREYSWSVEWAFIVDGVSLMRLSTWSAMRGGACGHRAWLA